MIETETTLLSVENNEVKVSNELSNLLSTSAVHQDYLVRSGSN